MAAQFHAMRRIRRPRPHLAQITYLLGDQRNRSAALRHIGNGSAMGRVLLKDGGHHPVDLRGGQQHPAGDILTMRDPLFGTTVAGNRSLPSIALTFGGSERAAYSPGRKALYSFTIRPGR